MKRVLSLVLVLVLVLGAVMPSFAEVTTAELSQETQDLVAYGIIEGEGNGNMNEAGPLTRAAMAKILAYFYGDEETAETFAISYDFTDVTDTDAWYYGWVNYAAAQGRMIGGGVGTAFRPNDTITTQEVNQLMIRVLGYSNEDVAWADVNAKAAELNVAVTASDNSMVLRGEAFKAIRTVLDSKKMGSEVTLGTELALPTYVAPVAPVTDLAVTSVTTTNLMQIVVEFNQNVEENEDVADAANYTLSAGTVANVDVDGSMATLTLTAKAAQQATVKVTISDAILAADTEVSIQFLDTTIPQVLSAEVIGNKTIKVTFSEPMDTAAKSNFSINGGSLFINTITPMNNGTEVNIELYSALTAGDLTVKASGVVDYAGFSILAKTFTVAVTPDTSAPVVVGFKDATPNGVTLIFNEEIKLVDGTAASFYHTNSSNPVDGNVVAGDITGKELKLKFTGKNLPQGTAYVYILKNSVKDLWDNKNAQVMTNVTVTIDTTAPEVKSLKVTSEDTIVVTFTEDLAAAAKANFTLLEGGEAVSLIKTVNLASDKATIVFTKKLSGDYALVAKDLKDLVGNEIADVTTAFTVTDLTRPDFADFTATLYNEDAAGQMVKVSFGEKMATSGVYSVTDLAKYIVDGHALTSLEKTPVITVVDDGKAIEIRIHSTADHADGVDLNDTTISMARVADLAGNYTTALSGSVAIDAEGTIQPTVQLKGSKAILVKFDDMLDTFDADDFTLFNDIANVGVVDAGEELEVSSVSVAVVSGKTQVTFNLVAALDTELTGTNVPSVLVQVTPKSSNVYGELVLAGSFAAADKAGPELDTTVATNSAELTLTFTENLAATALVGNDLVVLDPNNDTLVNGVDYTAAISTNTIVVTLLGVEENGEYTVNTVAAPIYIKDAAGNKVVPFTAEDAVAVVENTLPTFTASITGTAEITVVFSEKVDETDAELTTNYTFVDTSAGGVTITSATLQADGITVVIVTSAAVAATDTIDAAVEDMNSNTSATAVVTL